MKRFFVILACFFIVGCSTTGLKVQKLANIENKIEEKDTALRKSEAAYIAGAKDALEHIPQEKRLKEDKLALRFINRAASIVGPPLPSDAFNVDALLVDDPTETKRLTEQEQEDVINQKVKAQLLIEKKNIQQQINSEAVKLSDEHNRGLMHKVYWFLGIAAIGALLYFFGPILLPILASVFKGFHSFTTKVHDKLQEKVNNKNE